MKKPLCTQANGFFGRRLSSIANWQHSFPMLPDLFNAYSGRDSNDSNLVALKVISLKSLLKCHFFCSLVSKLLIWAKVINRLLIWAYSIQHRSHVGGRRQAGCVSNIVVLCTINNVRELCLLENEMFGKELLIYFIHPFIKNVSFQNFNSNVLT